MNYVSYLLLFKVLVAIMFLVNIVIEAMYQLKILDNVSKLLSRRYLGYLGRYIARILFNLIACKENFCFWN